MKILEEYKKGKAEHCDVTGCHNYATMKVDFGYKSGGIQYRCPLHPPMEIPKNG